jgi:hypothetical protein
MSLSLTSWILGLGGYAGLLSGLGLFGLYGNMRLLYVALLPLCPLIGAGAFYTFFHTVIFVIENAVRVGYLMLNEQIVVVTISSVFLGGQACMLGIVLYTQIREAREARIPEPQVVEEVQEEEEEAEEEEVEEEEAQNTDTNVEDDDDDDDMPGLIPADSITQHTLPVAVEPVVPTVEPVVPTVEPVVPTVEPVVPTVEPVVPTVEPVVPTVEPTVATETFLLQTSIPSTIVPSIGSIYMDMIPSLAPKNTQSHEVEFAYLDKDLA